MLEGTYVPFSDPQQQKFSFKYHAVVQWPCLISDNHSVTMFKKAALRPMHVPVTVRGRSQRNFPFQIQSDNTLSNPSSVGSRAVPHPGRGGAPSPQHPTLVTQTSPTYQADHNPRLPRIICLRQFPPPPCHSASHPKPVIPLSLFYPPP